MVTPVMPRPVDPSITDPAAMQLASEDRERAVAQARIDADTINAATSSVGATLNAKTLVVETTHSAAAWTTCCTRDVVFTERVVLRMATGDENARVR
jgi:hypothetical protein